MKLEVGKTYKRRDGRDVLILKMDAPGEYPVIGYLEGDESWSVQSYTSDGKSSAFTSMYSLTPEAIDVDLEVWVNVYANGGAYIYRSKNGADYGAGAGRVACVNFTKSLKVHHGDGLNGKV